MNIMDSGDIPRHKNKWVMLSAKVRIGLLRRFTSVMMQ